MKCPNNTRNAERLKTRFEIEICYRIIIIFVIIIFVTMNSNSSVRKTNVYRITGATLQPVELQKKIINNLLEEISNT